MKFEVDLKESKERIVADFSEGQEQIVTDFSENQKHINAQFSENQESVPVQFSDNQTHMDVDLGYYQTLRGVGIEKIEKTTTEGQVDTYVITLTDGKTFSFTVTNGIIGRDGIDGVNGKDGVGIAYIKYVATNGNVDTYEIKLTNNATIHYDITNGKDGYTPQKNVDYFDGEDGYTPIKGIDYFDGEDGYTPVKNVDYFDGKDGVGILRVGRSITNGNVDTYVIVLTNGDAYSFTVTNGVDGKDYVLTDKDKDDIAKQIGDNVDLSDCIDEINAVEEFVRGKNYIFKLADTIEEIEDFKYDFNFISNGVHFNQMDYTYIEADGENSYYLRYRKVDGTYISVYDSDYNGWENAAYQTIITDNKDIPLGNLATNVGIEAETLEGYKSLVSAINKINNIIRGNTWELKEDFTYTEYGAVDKTYDFNFVSNGELYNQIKILIYFYGAESHLTKYYTASVYYKNTGVSKEVYHKEGVSDEGGWINSSYRTITTDNLDVSLGDFATKIVKETSEQFSTTSKSLIGAINEINAKSVIFAYSDPNEEDTWWLDHKFTTPFQPLNIPAMIQNYLVIDLRVGDIHLFNGDVSLGKIFSKVGDSASDIRNWFTGAWDDVTDFGKSVINKVGQAGKNFFASIDDLDLLEKAHTTTKNTVDTIGGWFEGAIDDTTEFGQKAVAKIKEIGQETEDAVNDVVDWFKDGFEDAKDFGEAAASKIQSVGEEIFGKIEDIGNIADLFDQEETNTRATQKKTIIGAVNNVHRRVKTLEENGGADTSNLATVDKIGKIDVGGSASNTVYISGIHSTQDASIYGTNGESQADITFTQIIPIVAGENITFEVDDENEVVKVNATGGGSNNGVLSVTVETGYMTYVSDVITAIQNAGGDLSKFNIVTLTGFTQRTLMMSFAWRGGNYYRVECIDLVAMEQIYNAATDNSVYDVTSMRIEDFLNDGAPKVEMPQIRFTSMQDYHEDSCYKFTVEIVGGGALQEGDALQLCATRLFGPLIDEDGNIKRPAKKKLRRFAEYTVTADDLDKRFLTVNVPITNYTIPYLFFSNNKGGMPLSPLYLRIRRPKGNLQNNDTGMTVDATFSNVVQVWKTYKIENLTLSLV